jgi:pectinesterase
MYVACSVVYFALLFAPLPDTALPDDFVVAADGSGDYTTIQAAIDAAPSDASRPFVILIKNGIYREKIFIDKPFITLVGEDRDSTRIIYAELRSNWRKDHADDDWGSAVLNIGNRADDLTLANLTIWNNYGTLYGDQDHQFAVRSFEATRIIIINCNIKADGGDTLSLWNKKTGMYYHADCYFEGWVDYVCPRGWCYITSCRFFGYNTPSASIWHDGDADRDQKLVIRNSSFNGVPGFPLGRNHRDAQFYLLDCTFSENMADRPIYQAKDSSAYQWGKRYYYYNDHRRGGDYNWFADNLQQAAGAPLPEQITAVWTFQHRWNPEDNIPAVLPYAFRIEPAENEIKVVRQPRLSWLPARGANSYKIYLGASDPPDLIAEVDKPVYEPGKLNPDTRYYWRIDVITNEGIREGTVWSFQTGSE